MKFARQFAAVLLTVAAVTVLGVAWEHSSAAGWITPHGGRAATRIPVHGGAVKGRGIIAVPPGAHPPPGALPGHVSRVRASALQLNLSDIGNLTSTTEVVLAVMAGVIVLEIARRRAWRARRAARRAAHPAARGQPPSPPGG